MIIKSEEDMNAFYSANVGNYFISFDKSSIFSTLNKDLSIIKKSKYKIIDAKSRTIDKFSYYIKKKAEIELNYNEIYNFTPYIKIKIANLSPQEIDNLYETIYIDANRRLTNYITSLISFINDHIGQTLIKNKYGEDSDQFKKFKTQTNYWYDRYFSYRFFYNLRNYAVHYRFPLQSINIDLNMDNDMCIVDKIIALNFNKSKLLQNSVFSKKMNNDLKLYNCEFPLMPILEEIKVIHSELLDIVLKVFDINIVEAAEYLIGLIPHGNNPGIVEIGKIIHNSKLIELETKKIQIRVAEEIIKYSSI